jgi:hypothetical protein
MGLIDVKIDGRKSRDTVPLTYKIFYKLQILKQYYLIPYSH